MTFLKNLRTINALAWSAIVFSFCVVVFNIFWIFYNTSISKEAILELNSKVNFFDLQLGFWGLIVVTILNTAILPPIFEELIFRSWIRLKFSSTWRLGFFILFLLEVIKRMPLLGIFSSIFYAPSNFGNTFLFNSINSDFIFKASSFLSSAFISMFNYPICLLYAFLIQKYTKFLNIFKAKDYSKQAILINGLVFFLFHPDKWLNQTNLLIPISFLPFCIVLPYLAWRFGLKTSILIHALVNLISTYLVISDLSSSEFALYHLFYISTILTLAYLFIREIRLNWKGGELA